MSVLIDIAEAIKDELNSAAWDVTFSAERSYVDWSEKLVDLNVTHVDVVPWKTSDDLQDDRSEVVYQCEVDILIRRRFGIEEQGSDGRVHIHQMDAMVDLHQAIREFWMPSHADADQTGRRLTAVPNASWVSTRNMADYVRGHFKTRQYTGWIRVTFEITRIPGS